MNALKRLVQPVVVGEVTRHMSHVHSPQSFFQRAVKQAVVGAAVVTGLAAASQGPASDTDTPKRPFVGYGF